MVPFSFNATATSATIAEPSAVAIVSSCPRTSTLSIPRIARTRPAACSPSPPTSATIRSVPIVRFSSAGVPSAAIVPLAMMPTRSANSSASSRYWVVRKIVTPARVFRSRTSLHTALRLTGSRPVVGSSRKRICGPVDQRHRQVEPALHPARVRLDAVVDRGADVDQADDVVHSSLDVRARQAVQAALQLEQFPSGLLPVDRGVLERNPDAHPDLAGVVDDVEAGDARRPRRRA